LEVLPTGQKTEKIGSLKNKHLKKVEVKVEVNWKYFQLVKNGKKLEVLKTSTWKKWK
jgi:hypothetical protein